jgi:hypothetical protein
VSPHLSVIATNVRNKDFIYNCVAFKGIRNYELKNINAEPLMKLILRFYGFSMNHGLSGFWDFAGFDR